MHLAILPTFIRRIAIAGLRMVLMVARSIMGSGSPERQPCIICRLGSEKMLICYVVMSKISGQRADIISFVFPRTRTSKWLGASYREH
ncbi:hypothetical protein AO263_19115 [Pseudomonas sp. NZIPFR-PS5]|nr:hypothetical protein AO263_19115 [Pseudomonas sp. NZIPFR-PS5]